MKRKLWKVNKVTPRAKELAKEQNISPLFAQVLLNRNIGKEELSSFLIPSLGSLCPPELLPDIYKAVERIKRATKQGEKIFILGDYDVDGITSLAIFYEFIKEFPGTFSFYIPHRVKDGYGLNSAVVKRANQERASLIISFDCGTNADKEIGLARSYGIDTIIIDHHQPKDNLSTALAFVNPKRRDSRYPFCDLSSAALSFKLLQMLKNTSCWGALDLVALSLVCDVVPLKGENRILLNEGLQWLRKSRRRAIKALCKTAGIKQENINAFHMGYILGPRINASGRVAHAKTALDIFLTDNEREAFELADDLQEYNQLRRGIERQILIEAEEKAEELLDDCALVVYNDGWHPGVLGIIASRLVDKYYRPSFVISFKDDIGKGSARSIHSLHLLEVLEKCSEFLLMWGGHRRAAGIQILRQNVDKFKKKLNTLIRDILTPQDFIPAIDIDLILDFKDIDINLVEELDKLKPLGEDNPEALFLSTNVVKRNSAKKLKNGHSLYLSANNRTFEAVIYDKDILDIINYGDSFDIVYSLKKNNYHNAPTLIIRECRLSKGES